MTNQILALPREIFRIGSFTIYWYAFFILMGALVCYYVAQYLIKKDGYPHVLLENTFFIAFPAGIIGSRIWYVLSSLEEYQSNWLDIFNFRLGGLAIQGGVLFGVAAGVWYVRKYHPKLSLRYAMDIVIPNILIAQAIGRWGNFFNQEVYGACLPTESFWFLPRFIVNQMSEGICASGLTAVPLFLYESILNTIGFILITFVLRKFWKKRRHLGDLASLYFVWYGIVRLILEPLRQSEYIMMIFGIRTSVATAIGFIILGLVFMYLTRQFDKRKKINESV